MLIGEGFRNYLMQVFPKRNFNLLIDPDCIDQLLSSSHTDLFQLLLDLRRLNPPIDIRLLVNDRNGLPEPFAEVQLGGTELIEYSPTNPLDDDPRAKLMEDTDLADRQRKLCSLAIQTSSDGVVTSDQGLLDARYPLLYDQINLVPIDELKDFVEVCAHGHNVFWSASYSDAIYQDVYYILAHPKCHKLATWWREIQNRVSSPWVIEQLRSLILNRYQFILYARDMVKFENQKVSGTIFRNR